MPRSDQRTVGREVFCHCTTRWLYRIAETVGGCKTVLLSHLFSKDSQTLPQRVESSDWTRVVISMERKRRRQSNVEMIIQVWLK